MAVVEGQQSPEWVDTGEVVEAGDNTGEDIQSQFRCDICKISFVLKKVRVLKSNNRVNIVLFHFPLNIYYFFLSLTIIVTLHVSFFVALSVIY